MAENTIQNWLDDPTSVEENYAAALSAIAPAIIRKKRNELLAESDWTQIPDSALSEESKTAWATYRQELRDLPATATEATIDVNEQLVGVTWPTKP